jgi:putative ABC transport system permease protein
MPILFLTIAGLIIIMALGRMVRRDRQAIGVMKALGYSSWSVLMHYMKYSFLVALAGASVGVSAGLPLATWMTDYYMMFFNLPNLNRIENYSPLSNAVLMAFTCATAAGFIGARNILRITPAEAMRHEAPKSGGHIWLENLGWLWSMLPFDFKMAARNALRNKKRAFFGVFSVAITFSMIVFTIAMPATVDRMMGEGLREFQPMDYDIAFEKELSEKAVRDLRAELSNVERAEGKIEIPCKLTSGPRSISLSVIGVKRDTEFFRFRDIAGNALPVPKDGILLSDYAAKKLGVQAGDRVKLHSYLYETDDKWFDVSGIMYQALGVNAYMNIEVLGRSFLESGVVTGCSLDTDDAGAVHKLMGLPGVASVSSLRDVQEIMKQYTQMMNAMFSFLIVLSGLLGGAVIYSVTVVTIGERETEFSTLRVLGLSQWEIFMSVLRENNVVAALGFISGIPLTMFFLDYFNYLFATEQFTMLMRASPTNYFNGALLTILFIVLAQAVTWRRIKNLDFLSALKNRG